MKSLTAVAILANVLAATQAGAQVTKCFYDLDKLPRNGPKFSDYPVQEMMESAPAPPDFRTDPKSRIFRTRIRTGLPKTPNFAGSYSVVSWGCGTDCALWTVVDGKTGQIIPPRFSVSINYVGKATPGPPNDPDDIGIDSRNRNPPKGLSAPSPGDWGTIYFKKSSRLIIVLGALNEEESSEGVHYYLLQDHALKLIRHVKLGCPDG
jgi:hypothetical protein